MKKYIVITVAIATLLVGSGAAYWFLSPEKEKPQRYTRDPNAWTVPPPTYPMKGKQFVVPDEPGVTVTLDRVYPATKHDYPMGVFTIASGTSEGHLYAIDDLTTTLENGVRAVPIVVSSNGSGGFVYLAIIDETDTTFTHRASLLLGDRIRVTSVTRNGNEVTISYNVHASHQAMSEVPEIATTAIIDVAKTTFVQEGRKPWIEATAIAKEFKGMYWWQRTQKSDGTVVEPPTTGIFTLLFDGPRITLGTDCNSGSSEVTPPTGTSTTMSFGPVAATKKFCESSNEGPYFDMITQVRAYAETENTLTFTLADGSSMLFVREGQTLEFEYTKTEEDRGE